MRLRDPDLRPRVRAKLLEAGIDSAIYYERLLCDELVFHRVAPADNHFPAARDLAARTLALPFFVGLTPADVERIADALASAL